MLYALMKECRNYFPVKGATKSGTYKIEYGVVSGLDLLPGQYFLIEGSILNDGLHQVGDNVPLEDETFTGTVIPLAIPKAFLELADKIAEWNVKNEPSAFQSESFAGYSYSKASGKDGGQVTWKDAFRNEIAGWRKI